MKDINTEYEAILKELSEYDTMKGELESNMKEAKEQLENKKKHCSETRKAIDDITAFTVTLKDELQISHDEIDTTYCRRNV